MKRETSDRGAAISVEGLSKQYRLGEIGITTLSESLSRWWGDMRRGRTGASAGQRHSGGTLWALRDVSFEVKPGEVLGVIGRNGAGKSTLLKILTRITEPTSGRACLRGRVSSLLEVGTGFHPQLTGRENVYLNGAILGMRKHEIDRKFDEIVAFAEVEEFIDTPVKRYSSGMYVRLAFAVAAHLEPEILLVDEVLAVGDLAFQRKCLGRMELVAREGRTVLFVSHNMATIQALCPRSILLEGGKLAADGASSETIAAYLRSIERLADETPLEHRQDREGGKLFRFTDLELCDAKTMAPQNILYSGQDTAIRIHYDCRTERPMQDVVVSLAFSNPHGVFLTACRSEAVGKTFSLAPGRGTLVLKIPRLPFNRGRYTYTLIALRQGVNLDSVKEAGYIDVSSGDYYGTGKVPGAAQYGVFIDFDWEKAP